MSWDRYLKGSRSSSLGDPMSTTLQIYSFSSKGESLSDRRLIISYLKINITGGMVRQRGEKFVDVSIIHSTLILIGSELNDEWQQE